MKRLAFFIALMLCAAVAYGQTGTVQFELVLVANE